LIRDFVADSSIGVAWAIPSQSSGSTDQLLDAMAAGARFVVPVLWTFEIANAIIMLGRRRRINGEQRHRALQLLGRLRPVVDDEGPALAFRELSKVAERFSLSIYDAAYLELAVRRRLPLASRDADLNRTGQSSRCREPRLNGTANGREVCEISLSACDRYGALDAELIRAAATQLATQHEIPILGIKLDVVRTQKETTFSRLRSASALS
jgi:predicted nucleic acid-binding protein